jgi:hypothetical protein
MVKSDRQSKRYQKCCRLSQNEMSDHTDSMNDKIFFFLSSVLSLGVVTISRTRVMIDDNNAFIDIIFTFCS